MRNGTCSHPAETGQRVRRASLRISRRARQSTPGCCASSTDPIWGLVDGRDLAGLGSRSRQHADSCAPPRSAPLMSSQEAKLHARAQKHPPDLGATPSATAASTRAQKQHLWPSHDNSRPCARVCPKHTSRCALLCTSKPCHSRLGTIAPLVSDRRPRIRSLQSNATHHPIGL